MSEDNLWGSIFFFLLYGFWGSKCLYVKLHHLTAPPEGVLDDIISSHPAISISRHQEMSLFLFILMIIHQGTPLFKHGGATGMVCRVRDVLSTQVLHRLDPFGYPPLGILQFLLVLHVTLLLPPRLSVCVLINIACLVG